MIELTAQLGLPPLSKNRRFCGSPCGTHGVAVKHRATGGGIAGVQHCGSTWACPVCAPIIGAERAADLAARIDAWVNAGNALMMVTLTLRHHRGDNLSTLLDGVSAGWRAATSGRPYRDALEAARIAGYTRSLECTCGSNGFHPHIHALYWMRGPFHQNVDGLANLVHGMFSRWVAAIVKCGLPRPLPVCFDVRPFDRRTDQDAAYLVKMAGGADAAGAVLGGKIGVGKLSLRTAGMAAAMEMTRGDLKTGRKGSRTMWEVLGDFFATGDIADLKLWKQYDAAFSGRQMLRWSKGLREEIAALQADLAVNEKTDEQIVQEAGGGEIVGVLGSSGYSYAARYYPGVIGDIIAAASLPSAADAVAAIRGLVDRHNAEQNPARPLVFETDPTAIAEWTRLEHERRAEMYGRAKGYL